MEPTLAIPLAFGALLAITGIVLFARRGTEGHNTIKLLGMEFQLAGSSLVIFIAGVLLFALPLYYRQQRAERNERTTREPTTSVPVGRDEATHGSRSSFLLAGMTVSCDYPIGDMSKAATWVKDSSDAARGVAASILTLVVRTHALSRGDAQQAFECTFDDPRFYVKVVPLDEKGAMAAGSCRSFVETQSSSLTEGKRITVRREACLTDDGKWQADYERAHPGE